MPTTQTTLVLQRLLQVLRPLVRLAVRHGVTYPVLAAALKRVFLDAALAELARSGKPATDSAVTLLSGVHRRDVRTLTRGNGQPEAAAAAGAGPDEAAALRTDGSLGLISQVVAHWMSDAPYRQADGSPRVLPKGGGAGSFDSLVAGVSRDVRPRAVLDELLRLGVVQETAAGLALNGSGFTPRQGFDELSALFAANVHDHAAAAAANLEGDANFLEQAVFVDQISAASAEQLQRVAVSAWQQAFAQVMPEAQRQFDADAHLPRQARAHRARFGVYFFSEPDDAPEQQP